MTRAKTRVRSILNDYKNIADSDPVALRNLLPPSEVWRLFVDGKEQHRGWEAFDNNEPGYLRAMYRTFDEIYDFNSTLNSEWIKHLHKVATNGVKRTNYQKEKWMTDGDPTARTGQFRTDWPSDYHIGGCYFATSETHKTNATLAGIRQFLDKVDRENSWHAFSIQIQCEYTSTFEDILISKAFVKDAQKLVRQGVSDEHLFKMLSKYIYEDLLYALIGPNSYWPRHQLIDAFKLIGSTNTKDDLAKVIYNLSNRNTQKSSYLNFLMVSVQPEDTPLQLSKDAEYYFTKYTSNINAANNHIDRLFAIIDLVQDLEQLHPYSDANCRTFCMDILNYLLIRNGFPFAIMDDPNRFDLYSREELLDEVLTGMEQTFKLLEKEELYGYKVTDTDSKKPYFQDLTKLEWSNRFKFKGDLKAKDENDPDSDFNRSPIMVHATLFNPSRKKHRSKGHHRFKKRDRTKDLLRTSPDYAGFRKNL